MNLKNGYKTLFEVIEGSKRVFFASKTISREGADKIAEFDVNSVKVIYQDKDHIFHGIDRNGLIMNLDAVNNLFTEKVEEESIEEPAPTSYSRKRSKIEEPTIEPTAEPEVPVEPIETEEV